MSGGLNYNEEEKKEGWGSMLFKVAGAVAAVGGLYALLKQPQPQPEPPLQQFGNNVRKEKWTKPSPGWLKLNVDGSFRPQSESAGCGGVLRNDSGKLICGFAKKLDPNCRVDETEKKAILIGLEWAREKGVRKVIIESDNEGVVSLVNGRRGSNDDLICKIKELLRPSRDWEATLKWIPGDANQVADKVADYARSLSPDSELEEFNSPPTKNCHLALLEDGC